MLLCRVIPDRHPSGAGADRGRVPAIPTADGIGCAFQRADPKTGQQAQDVQPEFPRASNAAEIFARPKNQVSRNPLQGTWVGSMGKDDRTIVVGTGSVSVEGGPMGREAGPIDASTSTQVMWTTRPMSLPVKWTLTVIDGGTTARVTTKHLLGGQTGSFQ